MTKMMPPSTTTNTTTTRTTILSTVNACDTWAAGAIVYALALRLCPCLMMIVIGLAQKISKPVRDTLAS